MVVRKIAENVYYVGLDDNITEFFEGIWPLPYGVSYNTYLIEDNEVALIEPGVKKELAAKYLDELETAVSLPEIDYIIVNHNEPDHSGTLPLLYRLTKAKIIASKFGVNLIRSFYNISERVTSVGSGDSLKLGKTELKFITIPGVHWPDSMITYETNNKILFSSDVFGTFGSLRGCVFDSELDLAFYIEEAKRYFVNIIGKYAESAARALEGLKNIKIEIIAPAHGPVWKEYIDSIMNLYRNLASRVSRNKITIIYGTMYGFTEELAMYIASRLAEKGFEVEVFNGVTEHPSFTISSIWDSKVVIIGSPTYDNDAFLPILTHVIYIRSKLIKDKKYAIFGSFGWSGKGYKKIQEILAELGWKLIEPIVEFQGRTTAEVKGKADELVNNIIREVGEV
ncbi:MAG: FprA family A-type flavoprotein [Candidatus Korarchaeota archaeon]|nr:FprA family A-type flavoprotein [Thermoproteota archaeon]